ncbi:MAG: hypothetical protein U0793_27175 [Gemmataceae bacterium]
MMPRQLFLLAVLLLLGAALSAAVPEHPLFNQAAGKFVLSGMGLLCALVGLVLWLLRRRSGSP